MGMDDLVVYFYLVGQIQHVTRTKAYEIVYNDVTTYAPRFSKKLQRHLYELVRDTFKACADPKAEQLLECVK